MDSAEAVVNSISPAQLKDLLDERRACSVIDMRTHAAYARGHIPGSIWVDCRQSNFRDLVSRHRGEASCPLVVYCMVGAHSKLVCERLEAFGFTNVFNLEDGYEGWVNGEGAVVCGPEPAVVSPAGRQTDLTAAPPQAVRETVALPIADPGEGSITAAAAHRLMQERAAVVIDVRAPVEYREAHIPGTRNVPLHRLAADDPRLAPPVRPGMKLLVVCGNGYRSRVAKERFRQAGLTDVAVVVGGINHWAEAGLPLARGRRGVSVERQARFLLGFLVAAGAVLAVLAHAYAAVLPLLIGCGLMFSAVADTCAVALLLARMPWNQVPRSDDAGCEVGSDRRAD